MASFRYTLDIILTPTLSNERGSPDNPGVVSHTPPADRIGVLGREISKTPQHCSIVPSTMSSSSPSPVRTVRLIMLDHRRRCSTATVVAVVMFCNKVCLIRILTTEGVVQYEIPFLLRSRFQCIACCIVTAMVLHKK